MIKVIINCPTYTQYRNETVDPIHRLNSQMDEMF